MTELRVSGALLRDMFTAGATLLEKNKQHIDSLNVFPVPDGDTGTNMCMTMQSAIREMKNSTEETVSGVAGAVALGALKGARGNSGVILSQILRGFSRALAGETDMDATMFATAFVTGTEAAYKAVMKPKEGTMLTVSRMISEALEEQAAAGANVYKLIDVMLESGNEALKKTPDMLPVLKEAGVVDSGGKGLLTILRGFKMAVDGEEIDEYVDETDRSAPVQGEMEDLDDPESIVFGYCTEFFIIHINEASIETDLEKLREKLMKIGDSVVVAYDQGLVKVHVHSNSPGKIIQFALRLGEVDKIKIENMREQNREIKENLKRSEKENAMVAVSTGEGIDQVFNELGVSGLITGGQTMNPSIDSILKAVKKANARNVYVLPDNSNIILAAQQAAELSERSVVVIPTKTVMQGVSAAMAFNPDATVEENTNAMTQAFQRVISGSVTYAVRETSVDGMHINKDDIIGLMDNKIVEVSGDVKTTAAALLRKMIARQPEDTVITVFYGDGCNEADANALVALMEAEYPEAEFSVQYGGQPLYCYYFSVE